jgi:1-acyl-sn-glycerol-3-phosphate acyltransferase
MTAVPVSVRSKKVPTLYEADESKYVGPHRWQTMLWARLVRRAMRSRAYTRWVDQACERIDIAGLENLEELDGPAIFIANHQSHLDTLIVHAALPEQIRSRIYFGAAQDRWFVRGRKKTTLQPWYQSLVLGNFPILRGGGRRALSYAKWLLEKRQHVFLFPEGTRATDGQIGQFKHGATLLALECGVPVVPVYLGGLQKLRPKGQREVIRGTASIEFLKPVKFSPGSDVNAATELLRDRVNRAHQTRTASGFEKEAAPLAA